MENHVILENLFRYLPTKFLLQSCSMVSKTWNSAARRHIWSYRQCKAVNKYGSGSCRFLKQLDKLCGIIARAGRLIPFNCLELNISENFAMKRCCSSYAVYDPAFYRNLKKLLRIRSLKISCEYYNERDCQIHRPLLTMLTLDNTKELQSLSIDSLYPFSDYVTEEKFYPLPLLEKLDISRITLVEDDEHVDVLKQRETLKCVLQGAGNLKFIHACVLKNLKVLPEEILHGIELVGHFHIELETVEDADLLLRMCNQANFVTNICIIPPVRTIMDSDGDEVGFRRLCRKFNHAVETVFLKPLSRMKVVEVLGSYSFRHIRVKPLLNVTTLRMIALSDGDLPALWEAISTIQYDQNMPSLRTLQITLSVTFDGDLNFQVPEWPGRIEHGGELPVATGVRTLQFCVENVRISLGPLRELFPNIVCLEFCSPSLFPFRFNIFPIAMIAECFPELEVLKIWGFDNDLVRNLDAELIGIHEEEAERLRNRSWDDAYLENVVIVPLKPNLFFFRSKYSITPSHGSFAELINH